MRDYSLLFGLAALGLIVGCQQAPAPQRPAATPHVSPAAVARGKADQLMERGEYGKAAGKYQEVVALEPGEDYYRAARRWLVSAGLLSDGRVASAASETAVQDQAQQSTKGKVAGNLEWPGVNPRQHLIKVRMTLTGDDKGTRTVNLSRPFRLGDQYEFHDLAPGKYRLVAKAEDGAPAVELWNPQVTIEAGQVTQLPLSPTNSPVSPSAFPGETK